MGRLCAAALVVVLVSGEVARAQVPPPPPPPPPMAPQRDLQKAKTGTARLSGRVTALESGRPIRRAVVRAAGTELPEGKSVSTDLEGRWELRELPAGRYNLSVSKGGYVSLAYGQLRPFESGKAVELADGQSVERLDIALPRGSAVTGRVVDEFGDPVANARVTAMRLRHLAGQRRMMALGGGDTTDDLGQFRLHGLPPGEYYVAAQAGASVVLFGNSEDRTGYAQTFYPGVINASEAAKVPLAIGQEAQNILITLTPIRTATISGTARTSAGDPVATGMIMMRSANAEEMSMRSGMVRNGEWTLSGVAPGDYLLMLQAINLEQVALSGTTAQVGREVASEAITVSGEDIKGLSIVTSSGATLRGVVRFEGAAKPPPFSNMTVQALDPRGPEAVMVGMSGGVVKMDGSFEVRAVFGRRILRAGSLPAGWILQEVRHDGRDLTDTGIDASDNGEISGIEIVLTQRAAELAGTVQTSKGSPISDYVVAVFASDREKWGWQSRFVRTARPDQTGGFSIRGLPPGSYLAVALEYLETGEETNPDTLERLKDIATQVRLDEGEKKTLTLKLVGQ